jgi:hypothetical protein
MVRVLRRRIEHREGEGAGDGDDDPDDHAERNGKPFDEHAPMIGTWRPGLDYVKAR